MEDSYKTKHQLVEELKSIRARIAKFEQTEKELKKSEERFRNLAEMLPEIVFEIDLKGNVLFLNQAGLKVIGCTESDLKKGLNAFDLAIPEHRENIRKNIKKRLAGQKTEGTVYTALRGDGTTFPVLVYTSSIIADGKPIGLRGIMTDITERKKAEDEIRKSERLLKQAQQIANLGSFEWDIAANGVQVSQELYRIFGLTPDQKEALSDLEMILKFIHPDDRISIEGAMKRTLKGQGGKGLAFRIIRPDGSIRHIQSAGNIILDDRGNPKKAIGYFRDITDSKQAERELRQSKEKYKLLFNSLESPITVLNRNGIISHINKAGAKNLGLKAEDAIGKSLIDFFGERAHIYIERTQKSIETGKVLNYEDMVELPTGEQRLFLSTHQPLQDSDGKFFASQIISTDITDLKRAEDERQGLETQIQHAQKLESLGVLAGGIAHDFNNLLMGILGNADLALRKVPKTSPGRSFLTSIVQTSTHAAELCKQMLAYSGKGSFAVSPVDLNNVLNEMTHLVDVSVSTRASLKYNLKDGLPAIQADATQIRQIVMNLITNAAEAISDPGGVITVSTGKMECDRAYLSYSFSKKLLKQGVYVYLEVEDTGSGMDSDTQKKIFDPFFSTKFTGRGLGLSAVLGIVRGHKGAMKINSKKGLGTNFRVLFPSLEASAAKPENKPSKKENWHGSGTVLLVDDDGRSLEVAKYMLEEIGFTVVSASNGKDAIELLKMRAGEIICVLLDLTMPEMDGLQTFKELRQIQKDIPVVLSSGYNEQEIIDQFSGQGLAGFIQKPYRLDALASKLKSVLL